jgi:hypothetical protein
MALSLGVMALKFPVAWLLVYELGLGYVGLPLSHAILVCAECALLAWGFGRRTGGIPRRFWTDHARVLAATGVMGLFLLALRDHFQGLSVLLLLGLAGALYLGVAHVLGLDGSRQLLERLRLARRPRGLPPTVDRETAEALGHLAGARLGGLDARDGVLEIDASSGHYVVRARGGRLLVERAGDARGDGAPLDVRAVMRVGQGPPFLHGLLLGGRAFRAEADLVVEGSAPGPVLDVSPPDER